MNRVVRLTLAAGALVLVCACTSDSLNPPLGRPTAAFSDGAHSGNPDFFFLPPLFKNPANDPNFSPTQFNANVRPTVEICELAATIVPPATIRACATTVKTFGQSEIKLSAADQQYQVNWNTDPTTILVTKEYRIRVLVGTQELGYADVDPVANGSQLKNVQTGEYIGLVDGRTLPIKFRIENRAACFGGQCNSKTIDLGQGGFVVFDATGDRVDIPAQQSGRTVTVTVQRCPDLEVDIPVFGNCLRVTADPPLGTTRLAPPATVSMCSIGGFVLPPVHAQQDLLTLHRRDASVVQALPHAPDFCEGTIGRSEDAAPHSLAARGWRVLRHAAAWAFQPGTLHASNLTLDVGQGGQTDGFSDFQLALPAKMSFASLADQTVTPNRPVPSIPSVLVTDAEGHTVANARVHFTITSRGGSIAPTLGVVLTNGSGLATLDEWLVGDAGSYAVQASGFGLAGPDFNGPGEGVDPFAPAIFHNPAEDEAQAPVTLATGHLSYSATAAGEPDLTIEGIVVGPSDLTFADEITYDVTVRNRGTGDAPATTVFLDGPPSLDGDDVGADVLQIPALSPGAAATVRSRLGPRVPGTFSVVTTVDVNNTIAESNEENNTFTSEPFDVAPRIDFETLGNGTPVGSIALPLALVNDYALQGVAFSFVRSDETPGVASLCNSRAVDPAGVTDNHSASIEASGDPCSGWRQGALTMTFARTAGLPTTVRFQLRGNNNLDPFPISGLDGAGNALIVTRSSVSTYTSNNGFTARQETVEFRTTAGIVEITMNLPAGTVAVFLDDLVIIR